MVIAETAELVVVDASERRLDAVRTAHPSARWFDFPPLPGRSSIPRQRNFAVARAYGDLLVFIDASCVPEQNWLETLIEPIESGREEVAAGVVLATAGSSARDDATWWRGDTEYLDEAPTINLAVTRRAYETVGGFDEGFLYAGVRVRYVPNAIVRHDWGGRRDEMRRSVTYGRARARLYLKHPHRWRDLFGRDVIALVYPTYILALPFSLRRRFRWLPGLVLVPLWRSRFLHPVATLVDHFCFGFGVLTELGERLRDRAR
jgi:GT2 family glycosyltransferase